MSHREHAEEIADAVLISLQNHCPLLQCEVSEEVLEKLAGITADVIEQKLRQLDSQCLG